MKRKRARSAVVIIAAAVMIALASGFLLIRIHRMQRFNGDLSQIITFLALPDQSEPKQRFDAVRRFIYLNSRPVPDEESRTLLSRHENLVAEGLLAYATGKRSEPIHLMCGGRSKMMSAILRKLGYETRIVAVFDTDREQLRAHTFLEVRNPETGGWETQDPLFDLYWRSKRSGIRASLADSAEDISELEPCHSSGVCGSDKSELRRFLDIICVTNEVSGNRICRRTSTAKPDRIFVWQDKRGRFCDLMPNRCPLRPVSAP
jgi:hypothetical protein